MTQPAKVQEPSMEEILASIRRIIADDEAKPPAGDKPTAPAASAARAKTEKPAAPPPAPPKPAAPPAPAASNNQDDIDALLSGLDDATSAEEIRSPQPDG